MSVKEQRSSWNKRQATLQLCLMLTANHTCLSSLSFEARKEPKTPTKLLIEHRLRNTLRAFTLFLTRKHTPIETLSKTRRVNNISNMIRFHYLITNLDFLSSMLFQPIIKRKMTVRDKPKRILLQS